jgi:hypothetical protein
MIEEDEMVNAIQKYLKNLADEIHGPWLSLVHETEAKLFIDNALKFIPSLKQVWKTGQMRASYDISDPTKFYTSESKKTQEKYAARRKKGSKEP